MKKYVDGGEEVYPLRYALEDAYTANLMTTAAGNHGSHRNHKTDHGNKKTKKQRELNTWKCVRIPLLLYYFLK